MKTRKKGYDYVANVVVTVSTFEQAENFCYQKTLMGEPINADLKEEDILALFADGTKLSAEVDFEDDFEEAVTDELSAALASGAEITIKFRWKKSA